MQQSDRPEKLNICLLAPWYGGSHKRWADELKAYSVHQIEIYSLPAIHWKWRMHGAAITLAEKLLSSGIAYDLIIAEDMMDVAVFVAIVRNHGVHIPIITYFHENQISYPLSPRDTDRLAGRELRYGYINYTSALVSDRVYFNSNYHRSSFIDSLPGFLKQYPDFQNTESVETIAGKSETLPLGLELGALDANKPEDLAKRKDCPLLLWNHRREHDKNSEEFFDLMMALKERKVPFKLALLGKQSEVTRLLFESFCDQLGDIVVHNGEVKDEAEYAAWLWRADILPVTSNQDFFGGSVIEAVYCGCHPLLPDRLSYPEHFSGHPVYYKDSQEAIEKLDALIQTGFWQEPSSLSTIAARYKWENLAPLYDQAFAVACEKTKT